MMDKRKQQILLAITNDYIATGEPVGSRSIVKHYRMSISPATVRNEMADLEESGYLMQPHTSAGRIPSDRGYRFYVDVLMDLHDLSEEERRSIASRLEQRKRDIHDLVSDTAHMLSELCRTTAVVLGPVVTSPSFKHIDFVALSPSKVLVMIVANPGIVDTRVMNLSANIGAADLQVITNFLNESLSGRYLSDIDEAMLQKLIAGVCSHTSLMVEDLEFLREALKFRSESRCYMDGTSQMLEFPEFRDIDRVKSILSLLESESTIRQILSNFVSLGDVVTTIGGENSLDALRECSVVSASYGVGTHAQGALAVIGPTRMDYARVVSVVRHISRSLTEVLTRLHSE